MRRRLSWPALTASLALAACAQKPLIPYSADTPPLALVPAALAGVQDKRARFREIYCAVLTARQSEVPDHRSCDEALNRIGTEPAGSGGPVDLGPSRRGLVAAVVAGIGYECFEKWLQPPGTVAKHVQQFGYDAVPIKVRLATVGVVPGVPMQNHDPEFASSFRELPGSSVMGPR